MWTDKKRINSADTVNLAERLSFPTMYTGVSLMTTPTYKWDVFYGSQIIQNMT